MHGQGKKYSINCIFVAVPTSNMLFMPDEWQILVNRQMVLPGNEEHANAALAAA
jgi:hypothetical protein